MKYPAGVNENQCQYIKKTINLKDRKRKQPLLLNGNALLYLIKTICRWRMISENFPKRQLVYLVLYPTDGGRLFRPYSGKATHESSCKKRQRAEASLGITESQRAGWGHNRALHGGEGNKKIEEIL